MEVSPFQSNFSVPISKTGPLYDLCMRHSEMRRNLLHIQNEADRSNQGETRALVLAAKKQSRDINNTVQPAASTLSLLQKLFHELKSWLLSKGYLVLDDKVYLKQQWPNHTGF